MSDLKVTGKKIDDFLSCDDGYDGTFVPTTTNASRVLKCY